MTTKISSEKIPTDVVELCQKLRGAGHAAYVVGGAVRDLLRQAAGVMAKDFDIATSAPPEEVVRVFGARRTIPTGIAHGTVTVLCGQPGDELRYRHVEVTTFRGETGYSDGRRPDRVEFITDLVEDLRRRDFTINAIAYDPIADVLHDPFDGQGDLGRRLLRAVGDASQRFAEDGLRLLRAVRFAAQLGFAIDPATRAAFPAALPTLRKVSRERVRDELLRLLSAPKPSLGLSQMMEPAAASLLDPQSGLLGVVLPEVAAALAAEPGGPQHWLSLIDRVPAAQRLSAVLWPLRAAELSSEPRRFSDKLDELLKLPTQQRQHLAALIGFERPRYDLSAPWPAADVRRLLARHPAAIIDDFLIVERVDFALRAEAGATPEDRQQAQAEHDALVELAQRIDAERTLQPPLRQADLALSGKELMAELALKPSPIIGETLRHLLEAVLEDPARNRRDTLLVEAKRFLDSLPRPGQIGALALLALVSLGTTAWSAAAPKIASATLDVDEDGAGDAITVYGDGRISLQRGAPPGERPAWLSLDAGKPLRSATIELRNVGTARYLWIWAGEPQKPSRLLIADLHGGRQTTVYNGPIGPIGADGEYSVELAVNGSDLLRYQLAPAVRRCDGEARLFVERYSSAGWQPAPERTLPEKAAETLRTSATAPPDLLLPPLGIYRLAGASAQAGVSRADLLAPPRELEDGNAATPWRVVGDARGAFVTAQAYGLGHAVRALRIELPPSVVADRQAPPQLMLIFEKSRVMVDLLAATKTQWLLLPEPIPTRCLSLMIFSSARHETAIGDLAIFSELDGDKGLPLLVERVAKESGRAADEALGTLTSLLRNNSLRAAAPDKLPVPLAAVANGLATAQGEGLRRLLDVLLSSVSTNQSLTGAVAAELSDKLAEAIPRCDKPSQAGLLSSLVAAKEVGRLTLERLAQSNKLSLPLRAQVLTQLGRVDPTAAVPALLRLSAEFEQGTSPILLRGLGAGLLSGLRCREKGDPQLTQAEGIFSGALAAVTASQNAKETAARLALAATLVETLAQAAVGCSSGPLRVHRADWLVAAWPETLPTGFGSASAEGAFLVRYRILQGLERLETASSATVALLQRLLRDEAEPVLRQVASRALLVQNLPPGSSETLSSEQRLAGVRDSDPGVRLATLAALQKPSAVTRDAIGSSALLDDRLQQDGWPQVRRAAAEVRGAQCATPGFTPIPALRAALNDADEQVQRQVLLSLGRCEGANAIDIFERLLSANGTRAEVRGTACSLLARYGFAASTAPQRSRAHKAAATALLDLLQDPLADERHGGALSQCMRSISAAGDASDFGVLMDVAGSDVPDPLRRQALLSIGALCERKPTLSSELRKSLTTLLKSMQSNPDKQVQSAGRGAETRCQ